jgi:CHAT domain-containing protein
MKVALRLLTLAALLLCTAARPNAQETPDVRDAARRLASSADDAAVTVEGRQESLRKLEEAARLFVSVEETSEAGPALNRAGRLQLALNAPLDAVANHQRALELLGRTQAPDAEVDGLNGLGAAYMLLKKRTEADKALRRAVELSRQVGYAAGQAQALLTLSEEQNFYENHPLAVGTALEALALWQSLDDKSGVARTHSKLGEYYMAQNLLPESAENFGRALDLWRELNNAPGQAEALIMLGFVDFRRGEWSSSIALQAQARAMLDEKAEPYMMGQIAATTAEAFNENGLPEVGLKHYRQAMDYFRLTKDPDAVAYVLWGMGVTYYLLHDYPEAESHLRQSIAEVENEHLQAQCYEYLGRVYTETGSFDSALQNLQTALDIYTRAVNPREAAQVRALMGQVFERQGQFEKARRDYQTALATFDRLSDIINQAAVYFAMGRLELKRANYDAAKDYLQKSVEVTENIRRTPTSSDLTAAFSATVYERYEKYVECLMRLDAARPGQGFATRAFETSELARARSLAQVLRGTQNNILSALDPELAAQEKSLRQSLRVKEDERIALLAGAGSRKGLAELDAATAGLEEKYKQVTETIRARYPSYEQVTRPAAWDLRRIQDYVVADEQTVLIEYGLGEGRSYAWAVTRDGVASRELPPQAAITGAAQRVYKLLSTPPGPDGADDLNSAMRELAGMILSPLADDLRNRRRVIVVADGALNYIPFQVLPSPSPDGEPLIADYEVVNAPSASILGELRQESSRRQPARKVLAAFGNPVFSSDHERRKDAGGASFLATYAVEVERLRSALRDVELVGDSFDSSTLRHLFYAKQELVHLREAAGDESFVAEDYSATRERLLSADLTQYAILHFATHGLLDPKHPENSGLVLSTVSRDGREQYGFVGLQDIYSMRAPVDLVVLSACQTALGKEVRGEGLLSLTRGFMYAGASGVVASLWKVEDKATAELMKHFYDDMLRRGMPPGAALREAQNSIRKNPRWRSPYYWAAFTLQGEYNRAIRRDPPAAGSRTEIAAGAFLFMFTSSAVAMWWYRRRRSRTARGQSTMKV